MATFSASLKLQSSVLNPVAFATQSGPPLRAVTVEAPIPVAESEGDTWTPTWADNERLYSPSNDTTGFRSAPKANIAFNRIDGIDPHHLSGKTINPMSSYGREAERGPDGCTWKSSGCACIDGVLYWVVARHRYGQESGDPHRRQTANNASIIKSLDHGRTWTRSAEANYHAPMFPGRRFATPYFVQFGGNGAAPRNLGDYVYAISNNGFWDCGDDMIVGRVARSRIGRLKGEDWEFFVGGNGDSTSWTHNMEQVSPILRDPGKFGMTGAAYLPRYRRYFMIGWYYPAGGGKMDGAATHTVWDFYEAPWPWGPWTQIGSYNSRPSGYYSPQVCPKFQTSERVYAFTAGNWDSPSDYRLTVVPLKIQT
ncbi:MAG: hypothetical protein V4587_18680 [Acidobacteriota bacterium]